MPPRPGLIAPALRPLIGIPCCVRDVGESAEHEAHLVSDKYIRAVAEAAGGQPLLIPALGDALDRDDLLARLDGLFVTGSPSNVEPARYGGAPSRPGTLHDRRRDATTLPLLRRAIASGVPILAICRGVQELNVALGGTLHQLVHEVPGRSDHRGRPGGVEDRYAHTAHPVRLAAGGLFARLAGGSELMVNSVHSQGIDRLAGGLMIEATAPDGQIEAVRGSGVGFVVGVQWHPEFRLAESPFSRALFAAFGAACRERAAAG
jgi:putative glutamine amidotransferase